MGSGRLYLLSGVVDSKAEELRITFDDGRVVPYGLTGPLVPDFRGTGCSCSTSAGACTSGSSFV
jgi:hypothetical protein